MSRRRRQPRWSGRRARRRWASPRRVALPAGEAVRIEYESAPLGFVQYYVLEGDTLWTLTMNTDDPDADERVFSAIAATFTLGEG